MIVVDTSVWVDHLRIKETPLPQLLADGRAALHPFVMGELLLHGLPASGPLADLFSDLDQAPLASTTEVAAFIRWAKLAGKGIGYLDVHLLVSAKLMPRGSVITFDKRLHAQAERLGLAYEA